MTGEESKCWLRQRPIPSFYTRKSKMHLILVLLSGICSAQACGLTASEDAKLHPSPSFSCLAFFRIDTPVPWSPFFLLRTPANRGLQFHAPNVSRSCEPHSSFENFFSSEIPHCLLDHRLWPGRDVWVPELFCSGEKKWGTAAVGKGRLLLIAGCQLCGATDALPRGPDG